MKKNIISSSNGGNGFSNMLNPQMLQLFTQMMNNNKKTPVQQQSSDNSPEGKPLEKQEEKRPEKHEEGSTLSGEMNLIYNKQLADIIKNHDRLSRKLDQNLD